MGCNKVKSDFRAWNEAMSIKYNPDDYHERSFFLIKFIEKLRAKMIVQLLNPRKDDTVLEIGCGAGNLMQLIDNGRIIGLDLSDYLLRLAKGKRYLTKYDIVQSYGETLPFKNAIFDKIYCSEVLEHVREPINICREASRVLKNDGIFIISVPNELFINFIKRVLYFLRVDKVINYMTKYKSPNNMTDEWHLHAFSLDYLKKSIADIFVIKELHFVPLFIFPVRIIVSCSKKE